MEYTIENRGNKRLFKTFEKGLLEEGTLKLDSKIVIDTKKITMKQFISDFILIYNKQTCTYYSNGIKQEDPFKRRSAADIFRLTKYYYPKATLEQVCNICTTLSAKEVNSICTGVCSQIKRRVYFDRGYKDNREIELKDEFNRTLDEYDEYDEYKEEKKKINKVSNTKKVMSKKKTINTKTIITSTPKTYSEAVFRKTIDDEWF